MHSYPRRVAGRQASRLRLKLARAHVSDLLCDRVAGRQASRLRLKHLVQAAFEANWRGCGEASVASAIETLSTFRAGRQAGCVAGRQASRLRLKQCLSYLRRYDGACCGEASVASAIETGSQVSVEYNAFTLRGGKRRVCD